MTAPGSAKLRAVLAKEPFCGCGGDDEKWGVVLWVLDHVTRYEGDRQINGDLYDMHKAGTLTAFHLFALHVVDNLGLIEHGSGIMGSWLNYGVGYDMRAFLHEHGIDTDKWPKWARAVIQTHDTDASEDDLAD